MDATIKIEKERARAIAQEYRSKGYEVIEEPSQEQLPEFLSGYQPDLLIRRDNDITIMEVKSRSSLAKDPSVRELAQLLHAKPGWRFELIVVGEGEKLSLPEGTHPLEKAEMLRRTQEAERLLELGFPEAALLLAWSTSEAAVRLLTTAVRLLAGEEDIVLERLAPLYVLKEAVTNGVISRNEYNFLMDAMKYRNAIIHGFKVTDLNNRIIEELVSIARRMLQN